jgi:hypothetical protein
LILICGIQSLFFWGIDVGLMDFMEILGRWEDLIGR